MRSRSFDAGKAIAVVVACAFMLLAAIAFAVASPSPAHAAAKIDISKASISVGADYRGDKYDNNLSKIVYKRGKAVKPKVTVTYYKSNYDDDGNYVGGGGTTTLRNGRDYTISYSNNKNIGSAVVIAKGKGAYTGKCYRYFDISPNTVKGVKVKGAKKSLKVSWKKQSSKEATGYIVNVYTPSKKKVHKAYWNGKTSVNYTDYAYTLTKSQLVKTNTNSITIKKLKGKTRYYVSVIPYKIAEGVHKGQQYTRVYDSNGNFKSYKYIDANLPYSGVFEGNCSTYKAGKTK